jgi:excisionase family DNA binding protein
VCTMTTTITPPHMAGALTISQFCHRYGVCRETCYREIRAGRLRARKVGRRTVLLLPDVDAWAASLPELRAGGREQASA